MNVNDSDPSINLATLFSIIIPTSWLALQTVKEAHGLLMFSGPLTRPHYNNYPMVGRSNESCRKVQ